MKSGRNIAGWLAASCVFFASGAMATPTLSGTYTAQVSSICQMVANVDSSTGIISFDKRGNMGLAGIVAGTMSFDSGSGQFSSSGADVAMTLFFEKFSDGSNKGLKPTTYPASDSGSYSNTDTTLTLKGTYVYTVAYGPVDDNGIADSLVGVALLSNRCMYQVSLQHQ